MTTIEKKIGTEAREEILKATDGYEPDKQIAKKISLLFELPSEPYYKLEDLVDSKKEVRNNPRVNMIAQSNFLFASQLPPAMMKSFQDPSKLLEN